MRKVIIGSRDSLLAVAQTKIVQDFINENCDGYAAEILTMKTTGDKILDKTLDKIGGKGLFVKELDRALLDGRSELSVHSLKDLPTEIDEELPILGYLEAESPLDVLVLPNGAAEIDFTKPIGTASNRRARQFQKLYPDSVIKPIRGNLQTRLRKLDEGEFGAVILAAAGLKRLGLENRISREFSVEEMIPAAGQGVIAIQGRLGVDYSYLQPIFSEEVKIRVECERAFIKHLNGGCSAPVAAHCEVCENEITLWGYFYNEETSKEAFGKIIGNAADAKEAAVKFAEDLKKQTE